MDNYQYNHACRCLRCLSRGILWPILFITFGILVQLDTLGGPEFKHTWPIILLVIGGVKLLQTNASTNGHISPSQPPLMQPPIPPRITAPPADVPPPSGEVNNV